MSAATPSESFTNRKSQPCDFATRTDALTKSVFVMGVPEGLDFINTLPDIDAVAITPDRKVWYSKGLENPESPGSGAR